MCKDFHEFTKGFTEPFGAAVDAMKALRDQINESEGICTGAKEALLEMVDTSGAQLTEVGIVVALNGIAGIADAALKHAEKVQDEAKRN